MKNPAPVLTGGCEPNAIMTRSYRGITPRVAASAYVDQSAQLIGDVSVGAKSSVWPCAVLRGDSALIEVGEETNIQDGSILHTDEGILLKVGNRVTVGHGVMLHGCVLEDECLIGIGATVLNHARVGRGAVIGAGALIPEGMEVPAGMIALGVPAKVRREVTAEERERFRAGVEHYVERAEIYRGEA
jgi:carbonic anhydrase/acetyltransferase-like protein (isoleucine patch superfamily)